MRKFGLCLFYGLCVFTIAFSLFWMALPRLPLPEAPADETPPISGSVSSLVQAAAPTAAGYYLCDTAAGWPCMPAMPTAPPVPVQHAPASM